MIRTVRIRLCSVLLLFGLSACASIPANLISSPSVALKNIELQGLGFNSQKFMLSFDVTNPNPFPLPVRNIDYGVVLDGMRFASGETASEFTVPANGDSQFAISVDLDLLQTAPRLLSIIRDGVREDIPYALQGSFAVDIPFAPPVKYENNGNIRFSSGSR